MKRNFWQPRTLLWLCLLAYVVTAGGHFSATDEEDLFTNTALLSKSVLAPIDLDTANANAERGPQEVGQSLMALPWYWLGQVLIRPIHPRWHAYAMRAMMTTFNVFITLCTVWVLYRWILELASPKLAWTVVSA